MKMSTTFGARDSKLSKMKKKLPSLNIPIPRPPSPVEIDKDFPNLPQEVKEVIDSENVLKIWFCSGSEETGSTFKIDLETREKEWNSFILLKTHGIFVLPRRINV